MLVPKRFWSGIADGSVTVAFRRWKRPTVKAGGHLRSPAGYLAIDSVRTVTERTLTNAVARRAGYADVAELRDALGPPADGRSLYRIDFHLDGADPREVLRSDAVLDEGAADALRARLDRLDAVAPAPWTRRALEAIAEQPGVVSTELAARVGLDRPVFKANVRKLKALGLTESLDVGYRLSPRGVAALAALDGRRAPRSSSTG